METFVVYITWIARFPVRVDFASLVEMVDGVRLLRFLLQILGGLERLSESIQYKVESMKNLGVLQVRIRSILLRCI